MKTSREIERRVDDLEGDDEEVYLPEDVSINLTDDEEPDEDADLVIDLADTDT